MLMKYYQLLISIFILSLYSGMISGCTSTPEKKLKAEGFTLSYKDKSSAGSIIKKIQLSHPLKISEPEVRGHLESFTFEELSLFGNKKFVFLPEDIDRIARLLTKAIQRVPSHKIIHYEVETSEGTTEGDIFASKSRIHWRFNSINGMNFSGRAYTGWGNANWRLVPQSGQVYHAAKRLLGTQAHENWIVTELVPAKSTRVSRKKSPRPSKNKSKAPSREAESTPPAKSLDPVLEEKLQFLKDLHKKNLIDEKEYKQKRKELLDAYL